MRLPRWTVYPALALLLVFLVPALPRLGFSKAQAPARAAQPTKYKRVVALGIDGLDPEILAETIAMFPDHMEHWAHLIAQGGLHSLGTSTPPQSPVAWSNFTTGLDPGGHGIFDFIHRDPVTREPVPSTTRGSAGHTLPLWNDWQFPLGGGSESNRSGEAFWKILADHGVPADIWRMPANFPVEPARGVSFSGMMTPAIDSAYGECKLYTTSPDAAGLLGDGKVVPVREFDGLIETTLAGPPNTFKHSAERARVPLRIHIDRTSKAAAIDTGSEVLVLEPGQWSAFTRFKFTLLPPGLSSVAGTARFYLRSIDPDFELYVSPINIDPLDPISPISAPTKASKQLAEAIGLYYTQGMPEDVNALKEKLLSDPEFMQQSELVHDEGLRMMDYALDRYLANDDGGFLFFYYSGVDLCSHMMWRHYDAAHPFHDAKFAEQDSSRWSKRSGSEWKDVIHDLYMEMDPVLGHLRERVGEDTLVIVMSDHGFASYRRKFSLNTWLLNEGYLVLKPGRTAELARNDPNYAQVLLYNTPLGAGAVDWTKTRAYGVGFNGLYLNLAGRERDDPNTPENEAGIVQPGKEADALAAELKRKLEAFRDDKNGKQVILRADIAREIYHGARSSEAPDLLVGYAAEYGNIDAASLGRIPHDVLEDNLGGTFNGNHLMSPDVVPGTLLTNGKVIEGAYGLEDLTVEILKQYGIAPAREMRGRPLLR